MKIIKRDGREVPFDRVKIEAAIKAANKDVPDDAMEDVYIHQITERIEKQCRDFYLAGYRDGAADMDSLP